MAKAPPFTKSSRCFSPFTLLNSWVSNCLKKSHCPTGFLLKNDSDSVSWSCPAFVKVEKKKRMDRNLVENGELFCESLSSEEKDESFVGSEEISKENAALGWPMNDEKTQIEVGKMEKPKPSVSGVLLDMEMMKERFSKLLLGEDMSGCGKGVRTALAISNAITNLFATLFGQLWRLEPLPIENKSMWKREMECLLCVSDHIVEFIPSWQTFPDGSKLEVMTCRPRSDLFMNLPALRKLDNMLLETLDSFHDREFWYVDQGILAPDSDGSASFRRLFQRREEKWWLPVPRVPPAGLHEATRKRLQHKRECTNQILKAAMAINSNALAEMEVPEAYINSLPKNARESLGDVIHRYIASDQFSPECLIDCLEFSSEHQALEIANRVEASIYIWRRKTASRTRNNVEKRELFADRAESLMLCLKQKFPGLTQTSLDMSKIQFNKDVGKSILESYSRVLESFAFNIIARIDDLLYVDDLTKHSGQSSPAICKIAALSCATPSLSPVPLISPAKSDRIPSILRKAPNRGFSVKKALTKYLSGEARGRNNGNEW